MLLHQPQQHPTLFNIHCRIPSTPASSYSPSPTDTLDEDPIPSPLSPQYAQDMYHNPHYSIVQQHHRNSTATTDDSTPTYLTDSPSPVSAYPSTANATYPLTAPHSQDHFSPPPSFSPDPSTRYSNHVTDRYLRHPPPHHSLLDARRMSEPALFSAAAYASPSPTARFQQFQHAYNSPVRALHRGTSMGSLRNLHHQHTDYNHHSSAQSQSQWKHDDHLAHFDGHYPPDSADEPLSPLRPNFTGTAVSPTTGHSLQYSPIAEDAYYGSSPPGTGTSTESNGPVTLSLAPHPHHPHSGGGGSVGNDGDTTPGGPNSKTYSFVSLPGNAVKKRPRRRYDEIERLYRCSWPECAKAYGTLNHLNAHVTMQKHGVKRSPNEFKELRKQWRKAKKESEGDGRLGSHRRHSSHSSIGGHGHALRREESDYEYHTPHHGHYAQPQPHHAHRASAHLQHHEHPQPHSAHSSMPRASAHAYSHVQGVPLGSGPGTYSNLGTGMGLNGMRFVAADEREEMVRPPQQRQQHPLEAEEYQALGMDSPGIGAAVGESMGMSAGISMGMGMGMSMGSVGRERYPESAPAGWHPSLAPSRAGSGAEGSNPGSSAGYGPPHHQQDEAQQQQQQHQHQHAAQRHATPLALHTPSHPSHHAHAHAHAHPGSPVTHPISLPHAQLGHSQHSNNGQHAHTHPHPQAHALSQSLPTLPSPSNIPMNRLPPDSTLLTPLPGYERPALLPPLVIGGGGGGGVSGGDGAGGVHHGHGHGHHGSELIYPEIYDDYGREVEREDRRPDSGHASVGSLEEGSGAYA